MTPDEQIHEVEISIEEAKQTLELRDALRKLRENPDFKKVIEENYFKEEASRLVLLKADMNVQDREIQKQINKQIDAIGYFRGYLQSLFQLGSQAEQALAEAERTREEILEESADV